MKPGINPKVDYAFKWLYGKEELKVLAQDEQERERYEARLKGQRDYAWGLKVAQREGMAKGRAEGVAVGEKIGGIHFLQRRLGQPLTPEEDLLKLTDVEREQLEAVLEQAWLKVQKP